jgi:hypothetical protein
MRSAGLAWPNSKTTAPSKSSYLATTDYNGDVLRVTAPVSWEYQVSDEKGWPDDANPGFPTDPDDEGPHLIKDQYGRRRWYFWMPTGTRWFNGQHQCDPVFAAAHWTYIGAAIAPDSKRFE